MKYNPHNIDLSKGKQKAKVGYNKGTQVMDTEKISDIIANGGQVYALSQSVNEGTKGDVQVIEIRIYFMAPDLV